MFLKIDVDLEVLLVPTLQGSSLVKSFVVSVYCRL